jgi:hypothetical protein
MVTWLNLLRDHGVPKDIRRLIYAKLDRWDKEFVKSAHNSKYPLVLLDDLVDACAKKGHLSLIQWMQITVGLVFQDGHGVRTAFGPNCKWAIAHGAADGGSLPVLQWVHEQGWSWPLDTIFWIVRSGRLDILQWFVENVHRNWKRSDAWKYAQTHKHYHILQWMIVNGLDAGSYDMSGYAAAYGDLTSLEWLKAHHYLDTSVAEWSARQWNQWKVLDWLTTL